MIVRLFFIASLATIAFIFGMLGLWVADRDIPVVGTQSTVLNQDVAPGQIIRVKTTAYRIRTCRTLVERYIIDSASTRFMFADIDYINPGPPGAIEEIIELSLPQRANVGIAIIKTNASWECNPGHRIWPIIDRQPDIAVLVTGGK